MKKTLFLLITAVMILLTSALPVFASTSQVVDGAGRLTDAEKSAISDKAASLSGKYKIDVVVVTTSELELSGLSDYEFNRKIMNYADDYYDYNGFGKDGMLLLVAFDGDDIGFWISTTGKCYDYFTTDDIDDIRGDYSYDFRYRGLSHGKAIENALDGCGRVIKDYRSVSPVIFIAAVLVGIIATAVITGKMKRQLKSVRSKAAASDYVAKDSLNITQASEKYLYKNVTRVRIDNDSRSGGSHGGHISSSGSSHGGGGGRV